MKIAIISCRNLIREWEKFLIMGEASLGIHGWHFVYPRNLVINVNKLNHKIRVNLSSIKDGSEVKLEVDATTGKISEEKQTDIFQIGEE